MRIGRNKSLIGQWSVIIAGVASLVVLAEFFDIDIEGIVRDAIIYTVIVFAVVIVALRPAWRCRGFWMNLTLLLSGHIILLLVVIQVLPPSRAGVPKILVI